MIVFKTISVLIFSIVSPLYNLPQIVELDRSEIVSYVIISFIICFFITSIHEREILHEIGNEYLSNYDVLTGAKYRNSFEQEHMPFDIEKSIITPYIYSCTKRIYTNVINQKNQKARYLPYSYPQNWQ